MLAPKKTVALQARRGSPPNIAPVSGESGAGVTASSAGLAPFVVVPVPSVGQAVDEAKGEPSKVATQPTTEVMPLPMLGWAKLSAAPIASTTAGVAHPDEVPPMEAEVMVATTDGS